MKTYQIEHDFLMEGYNAACPTWKEKIKAKFPDAFKSELEVGKWYKTPKDKGLVFIEKEYKSGTVGYGFTGYGNWTNEWHASPLRDNLTLATEEEVKTALIGEAEKRGFKVGVTYNATNVGFENQICLIDSGNGFEFNVEENILRLNEWRVFSNGKWAEIIKEIQITQSELIDFYKKEKGIDNLTVTI